MADSGVAAGWTRKACRGRSSTSLVSLRRLLSPRWTICRLNRHSLSQHVSLMRTNCFDQVGGPRQEERERRRAPIQLTKSTGLPCCWCLLNSSGLRWPLQGWLLPHDGSLRCWLAQATCRPGSRVLLPSTACSSRTTCTSWSLRARTLYAWEQRKAAATVRTALAGLSQATPGDAKRRLDPAELVCGEHSLPSPCCCQPQKAGGGRAARAGRRAHLVATPLTPACTRGQCLCLRGASPAAPLFEAPGGAPQCTAWFLA